MIERSRIRQTHRIQQAEPTGLARDERSMRVFEYAMAFVAVVAAALLAVR